LIASEKDKMIADVLKEPVDSVTRFMFLERVRQIKNEQLKEMYGKMEMSECTFKPSI